MKLADVLHAESVELKAGDYLVSFTDKTGYVPFHADTANFDLGRHLYQLVSTPDGLNLVPVVNSEDNRSTVLAVDSPVVVQTGNKVVYMTGRNNQFSSDGYHGRRHHIMDNIEEGEEHRHMLLGFLDYAKTEYSMGVNDFMIAKPEMIEGETENEDEPPAPPEDDENQD